MKRVLLAIALVFALTAAVSAQVPSSPFSLYVGGAVSMPQSPDGFKETYKTGYHGFAGVGFSFMPKMQLVGKVEYNTFSYDWDNNEWAGLSDGGSESMLMFGADARLSIGVPAAPFKPFLFGGGGFAHMKTEEFSGTDLLLATSVNSTIEDQTKPYFNVGAGAEFKMGPAMSFFAQARYVSVATEGESASFIPLSLGLKFF